MHGTPPTRSNSFSNFWGLSSSRSHEKPFSSTPLDEEYVGPVNKIVMAINTALDQRHKLTGKQIFEPGSTTTGADGRLQFITLKIFSHTDGLTLDQTSLATKLIEGLGRQLSQDDFAILNIQLRNGPGGAYYLDLNPEELLNLDLSYLIQKDIYTESIDQLTNLCNILLQNMFQDERSVKCERHYEFNEKISSGRVSIIALKLPQGATEEETIARGKAFKKRLQELLNNDCDRLFSSRYSTIARDGSYFFAVKPDVLLSMDLLIPEDLLILDSSNVVQEDIYTESIDQLTDLCNSILQGQHSILCERYYKSDEGISSGEVHIIGLKLPPCSTEEETIALGKVFQSRLQELLAEDYDRLFSSIYRPIARDGSYFLALKPDVLRTMDFSQKMRGESDEAFEIRSLRTEVFGKSSPNEASSFKEAIVALQNIFTNFKNAIASGGRYLSFTDYINQTPSDRNILRKVFNSADPALNKKKSDACVEYCKTQDESSSSPVKNFNRRDSGEISNSPLTNSDSHSLANRLYKNSLYQSIIDVVIPCCYSYITHEEQQYASPVDCFIKASDSILNHRYAIDYGQLLHSDGPIQSIRIKIVPRTKATSEAEINLKLIQELKNRLGEEAFNSLVIHRQGTTNRTYLIDLDVQMLQKLESDLSALMETMTNETPEQFSSRSTEFVERNVQAFESNEAFQEVCEVMERDGVNLISKGDFVDLCRVYNYFKEAVVSDTDFQNLLSSNPTLGFNPKDEMDMNIRYQCFGIYLNTHPDHKSIVKQMFNYADPEKNRAKYTEVSEYFLQKVFPDEEKTNICSALREFLTCSYQAIRDEEKMFLQAGDNLCNTMNFIFAYTNPITCQPRFPHYEEDTGTVSGSVESILVKRKRQEKQAAINDITLFREDLQTLLIGETTFKDLVKSPDPTEENIEDYITADGLFVYVLLDPSKFLDLNTNELMPLSSSDLKMYEILLDQEKKATDDITILDTTIQSYKTNLKKYQREQETIEQILSRTPKKLTADKAPLVQTKLAMDITAVLSKKSQSLTLSSGSRKKSTSELEAEQHIKGREETIANAKIQLLRSQRAQKVDESELSRAEKNRAKFVVLQTTYRNLQIMYSIHAQFSKLFESDPEFREGLISRLQRQDLNEDRQHYACFSLYLSESPQHQATIQNIFKNTAPDAEQVSLRDYKKPEEDALKKSVEIARKRESIAKKLEKATEAEAKNLEEEVKKLEEDATRNVFEQEWYRSLTKIMECCFFLNQASSNH